MSVKHLVGIGYFCFGKTDLPLPINGQFLSPVNHLAKNSIKDCNLW